MTKFKPIIIVLLIVIFTGINTVVTCSAEEEKYCEIDNSSNTKQYAHNLLINLQVDAENTGEHLFKVLAELERRGDTTTVYVAGTFTKNNGVSIQDIQEHGHDIAFHGWVTGEKLETMNYST